MNPFDVFLFAQTVIVAFAAVLLGLLLLAILPGHLFATRETPLSDDSRHDAIFIFDGETMIDCSAEARAILAARPGRGTPWARLSDWLETTFPHAEEKLRQLPTLGRFALPSADGVAQTLLLQVELQGGLVRITVSDASPNPRAGLDTGPDPGRAGRLSFALLSDEVDCLRDVALHSPWMCWREREDGKVIWANGAYLSKLEHVLAAAETVQWPLPRLFGTDGEGGRTNPRKSLERLDGAREWFDLVRVDLGATTLVFAQPADATVRAETILRDFVQNLTRVFSHVPVGIAIFDAQRRLTMFNPALTDLTGLPVEVLSARPTLVALLDAMRDRNLLPEPRDYRAWRARLDGMEDASTTGLYEEDWSMPGGQTYRVIGRPQPDGSLVIMMDDISTETLRAQRYRADMELGQAVIDGVDDAIAVFAPSGHLAMSNTAYARLWGHAIGQGMDHAALADLVSYWQARTAPSAVWQRLADFVTRNGDGPAWEDVTRMSDGRLVFCEVKAIAGGATLATFRAAAEPEGRSGLIAVKRSA